MAMKGAGILLLDEPTNHLDVDAVDGLAKAIREFDGGVVLVSHDFRLIDQVANEIWVCEDKGIRKYTGDIHQCTRFPWTNRQVQKSIFHIPCGAPLRLHC